MRKHTVTRINTAICVEISVTVLDGGGFITKDPNAVTIVAAGNHTVDDDIVDGVDGQPGNILRVATVVAAENRVGYCYRRTGDPVLNISAIFCVVAGVDFVV